MDFDRALECVAKCVKGTLMAKCHIQSAFRLLPVQRDDVELLCMMIKGKYYVDRVLPMGCSTRCSLFEKFITFLHWRLEDRTRITTICHHIDDPFLGGQTQMRLSVSCRCSWHYLRG